MGQGPGACLALRPEEGRRLLGRGSSRAKVLVRTEFLARPHFGLSLASAVQSGCSQAL